MARIPEEIIQRVQEAVDIADVISRYATLKRAGRNFKALCPFHEEKTPSFTVFPESQRFKCFGCGEGGNVFTFLMKHNNLGFRDVLEELARDAAIELPCADTGPEEAERAIVQWKACAYMREHLGEEFDARVTGLASDGVHVRLQPHPVDGWLHFRDLASDFYERDRTGFRLVGKKTGRVIRTGDPIRIRVSNVNMLRRRIDVEEV